MVAVHFCVQMWEAALVVKRNSTLRKVAIICIVVRTYVAYSYMIFLHLIILTPYKFSVILPCLTIVQGTLNIDQENSEAA